jgi:LysM repeat protein
MGLLVGFAAGRALAGPRHGRPARTYVVRAGDTLWGIARRIGPPEADPRPVVDRLEALNHLAGPTIVVGQRLALPAA